MMDYHNYQWKKYSTKWYNGHIRVICWECVEMPNMIIMSVKDEEKNTYYWRVLRRDGDNTLHDVTGKLNHMYLAKWQAWKHYNDEGIGII